MGVAQERFSRTSERETTMGSVEERHPEGGFEKIHLLDDRSRRYVELGGCLGEAAALCYLDKRV